MSGRFVAISASFSVRFLHLEFVSESVERSEFLIFDKFTGHLKKNLPVVESQEHGRWTVF